MARTKKPKPNWTSPGISRTAEQLKELADGISENADYLGLEGKERENFERDLGQAILHFRDIKAASALRPPTQAQINMELQTIEDLASELRMRLGELSEPARAYLIKAAVQYETSSLVDDEDRSTQDTGHNGLLDQYVSMLFNDLVGQDDPITTTELQSLYVANPVSVNGEFRMKLETLGRLVSTARRLSQDDTHPGQPTKEAEQLIVIRLLEIHKELFGGEGPTHGDRFDFDDADKSDEYQFVVNVNSVFDLGLSNNQIGNQINKMKKSQPE